MNNNSLYPNKWCGFIDAAYTDRQEMINDDNTPLEGHVEIPPISERVWPTITAIDMMPDTWEAIEAQLDYWAEMDAAYWQQRKEKAYAAWFERTYGVNLSCIKKMAQAEDKI